MLRIDKVAIKRFIEQNEISLSEGQINALQKGYLKLQHLISSVLYSSDLHQLAIQYEAGKPYWYLDYYSNHFNQLRRKKLNILEVGVGGYESPKAGGGSLRMWQNYFPNSTIHGIDIYDKKFHADKRIKIYQGSQIDRAFLNSVIEQVGQFDIVIDDGSHINEHVLATFEILFPALSANGIYVVEDTHTSYWKDFGGSTDTQAKTMMNFFRKLVDEVNYEEYMEKNYVPHLYQSNIVGLHFYHSILFIQKGDNTKGSPIRGKLDLYF